MTLTFFVSVAYVNIPVPDGTTKWGFAGETKGHSYANHIQDCANCSGRMKFEKNNPTFRNICLLQQSQNHTNANSTQKSQARIGS